MKERDGTPSWSGPEVELRLPRKTVGRWHSFEDFDSFVTTVTRVTNWGNFPLTFQWTLSTKMFYGNALDYGPFQ